MNGKPIPSSDVTFTEGTDAEDNDDGTFTMSAGGVDTGQVSLSGFSSGTNIDIMTQTATGNQYTKVILLPWIVPFSTAQKEKIGALSSQVPLIGAISNSENSIIGNMLTSFHEKKELKVGSAIKLPKRHRENKTTIAVYNSLQIKILSR